MSRSALLQPLSLREAVADDAAYWLSQRLGKGAKLHSDTRKIQPGDGFIARPGKTYSSAALAAKAMEAGAAAIVVDGLGENGKPLELAGTVARLEVPELAKRAGMIASTFYGRPSMTLQLIAVTGTNGKSTVSFALAHALARSGIATAAVGTLGVGIFPAGCAQDFTPSWSDTATSGLTTPDAVDLQTLLFELKQRLVRAVVLEASSIGLEQGRLQGCAIKVAAFTNLSHDHLDIHGTMENYAKAKALLFSAPTLASAVINIDDPFGMSMWQTPEQAVDRIAIGRELPSNAHSGLQASRVSPNSQGMAITLEGKGKAQPLSAAVQLAMHGQHNVENALIVAGCLWAMKLEPEEIHERLGELRLPPGRLQMLAADRGPLAYIDYAHSPIALQSALQALRPLTNARSGRLVCVFGCGGDRDAAKRPLMGEVASRLADLVLITSDNPRSEDPQKIIDAIASGVPAAFRAHVHQQLDRAQAIAQAIAQAHEHDVVLIAGKGHESNQWVGSQRLAFSDQEHAQQALKSWGAVHA
jgi:UDP-N-acetylmuramyl-tripeptide synthetase